MFGEGLEERRGVSAPTVAAMDTNCLAALRTAT